MKKFMIVLLISITAVCTIEAGDMSDALKNGTFSAEFQLGFEYSDFDDAADLDSASGLTLRSRLGFRTAEFNGFSAFIQLHNVSHIIDNFRFPGGGDTDYDVIADPDGSRIHQAYFDLKLGQNSIIRAGRQEFILEDARLVGNVGWRQNGQSFDGVTFRHSLKANTFSASYITRVNTITLSHVDLDSFITLNNTFIINDNNTLTGFAYFLDSESEAPTSRDNVTYGCRLTGKFNTLSYDIAYAMQGDYADGENFGGTMMNLFIATQAGAGQLGVGYNLISGQDGADKAFDTLFSTAHKFNGWADAFLATNGGNLVNGLQDIFVQYTMNAGGIKWLAKYHMFDTDQNVTYGEKYGTELDLLAVKKINKQLTLLAKAAFYSADDSEWNPTSDENIFWLRASYKF